MGVPPDRMTTESSLLVISWPFVHIATQSGKLQWPLDQGGITDLLQHIPLTLLKSPGLSGMGVATIQWGNIMTLLLLALFVLGLGIMGLLFLFLFGCEGV